MGGFAGVSQWAEESLSLFKKGCSSRQLECESHRIVELMRLIKRLTPDFKTITDFRRNNRAEAFICHATILSIHVGAWKGVHIQPSSGRLPASNEDFPWIQWGCPFGTALFLDKWIGERWNGDELDGPGIQHQTSGRYPGGAKIDGSPGVIRGFFLVYLDNSTAGLCR